MRRSASLAGVVLALFALSACAGTDAGPGDGSSASGKVIGSLDEKAPLYDRLPEGVSKAGKLVMGSQLASPPIIAVQDDGQTISGVNVDLAAELSGVMGVPVEFIQVPFSGLIPALDTGKIDGVFDLMSDTAERRDSVDFIDFMSNGLTLLVSKGNPKDVVSVKGLCGKNVAGVRGTGFVAYAESMSQACIDAGEAAIDVKQYASAADGRLQVQTGAVAAFLGQTPIMLYLASTVDDGNTFDTVIDPDYPPELTAIAVSKDRTDLRDLLRDAFAELIKNGQYAAVLDKHGMSDLALPEVTVNAGP